MPSFFSVAEGHVTSRVLRLSAHHDSSAFLDGTASREATRTPCPREPVDNRHHDLGVVKDRRSQSAPVAFQLHEILSTRRPPLARRVNCRNHNCDQRSSTTSPVRRHMSTRTAPRSIPIATRRRKGQRFSVFIIVCLLTFFFWQVAGPHPSSSLLING